MKSVELKKPLKENSLKSQAAKEKQIVCTDSEKDALESGQSGEMVAGPDEGWAWVVAFASCMINFIMAGLGRISGILFMALIEIYGVDRKSASMPFSVRSSAGNLFGPIVGILGQKYGARKIIVIGSLIGTISSAACFFTPSVMWITVLWGGVSGIGAALTVTLPQVVIGQWFDTYRTTAVGIAFSGGCFGSFVFPILLEYLLVIYGIEGTFLIVGAIIMHCIPAALILRKPPWLKTQPYQALVTPKCGIDTSKDFSKEFKGKEGSEVAGRKSFVSVTSVNECTPKTFTRIYESRNVTESVSNSRLSVRSINECTPKRSTPRSARKTSEIYPDFKLLYDNSNLVVKILNLKPLVATQDLNQNKVDIMDIIEDLCNSLRVSRTSQYTRNLRLARNSLFSYDDKDFMTPSSPHDRTFSFDTTRLSEFQLQSVQSPISVPKQIDETSRQKVLLRLSDLSALDDQIIIKTLDESKKKTLLVLTELRKIDRLCPRTVESISSEVFDEPVKVPKDVEFVKPKFERNSIETLNTPDTKSASFLDHILTAFKLYVNPLFIMVCLCRLVHFITFIPAMTTVVDFTIDKGFPEEEGKYAIAAISIGDLLGRLCLGWVTDRGYMTLPKYMMVVMMMQGCSTASLPLMDSQISMFVNLAVFGLLQGSLFVRHSVLISKYMLKEEQSIAMGCVNFISGIIGFGLPLYIGYFRDTMGSYDLVFHINGLLGACVGLLWAFEPLFVRYVNSKRTTQKI